MSSRQTVTASLVLACCACILVAFVFPALAQDAATEAWVWNSESFRVMIYEADCLKNENRFYHPYLLNGFPVRVLDWSNNSESACISFLDKTYWVDSRYLVFSQPQDIECTLSRCTTKVINLPSQNGETIPIGTRVDIWGYTGDTVIIDYDGDLLPIHPTTLQWIEITYDAPEYLIPKADMIALCKQELVNKYGLSPSDVESMRIEFVSYSTVSYPSRYFIHFYTDTGESYSLDCDGEYCIILHSHYAPYGLG